MGYDLPERLSRGKRGRNALEDDADADFWEQDFFKEEDKDEEYESESVEEDVADSDFSDSVSSEAHFSIHISSAYLKLRLTLALH